MSVMFDSQQCRKLLELNNYQARKAMILKVTVVNRTCQSIIKGSLETMFIQNPFKSVEKDNMNNNY